MSLIIKEIHARREKERSIIQTEMLKNAYRRWASSEPLEQSEEAFMYKIRALRSQFDSSRATKTTEDVCQNLRDIPEAGNLPIRSLEPSLILDLL